MNRIILSFATIAMLSVSAISHAQTKLVSYNGFVPSTTATGSANNPAAPTTTLTYSATGPAVWTRNDDGTFRLSMNAVPTNTMTATSGNTMSGTFGNTMAGQFGNVMTGGYPNVNRPLYRNYNVTQYRNYNVAQSSNYVNAGSRSSSAGPGVMRNGSMSSTSVPGSAGATSGNYLRPVK